MYYKRTMNLCQIDVPIADISQKRQAIYAKYNYLDVETMTNEELFDIFSEYDRMFYNYAIRNFFQRHSNHALSITLDDFGHPGQYRNFGERGEIIDTTGISGHSMTETYDDSVIHRILISRPIFSELFSNGLSKECSNGLVCTDKLACLLITLEHEIVHLIIDIFCPQLENGHGTDFQNRVEALFGQTDTKHTLGKGCKND